MLWSANGFGYYWPGRTRCRTLSFNPTRMGTVFIYIFWDYVGSVVVDAGAGLRMRMRQMRKEIPQKTKNNLVWDNSIIHHQFNFTHNVTSLKKRPNRRFFTQTFLEPDL